MQVNSTRQDLLQQVNTAISDRRITPQEMQSLQGLLASSNLNAGDKQAVGQILNKLGEFSQSASDRLLSVSEIQTIQTMAAQLDSPAATQFTQELETQAAQPPQRSAPRIHMVKAPSEGGETEASAPKKHRNFFQMIWDALKSLFNWIASLFGGGDKNHVKGPGPAGSAASAVSFDEQPPVAAPPELASFDASQDYSATEFKESEYLNEYRQPEVPINLESFNQYLAVPSRLTREDAGDTTPPGVDPADPSAAPTAAPDKPTSAPSSTPSGPMYQRSRYHDATKFVPRFPMAAFHESGVYRKEGDPYAVGAISKPKKSDDLGGKTYGTYQFESSVYLDGSSRGNRGGAGSTLSAFINDPANPFGPHLKAAAQKYGLASKPFDALWTKFSREYNQEFGQAQEAFVLKDKGDNVQRFMDKAQLSPEVRQDSRIVDLIMGTTNHVGDLADSAATYIANRQRQLGRPMTANEVGKAIAEYKETKITSWFRSSPGAHAGIENRFEAEARAFS
ncbi:hypothetical protein COW36_17490 [bacterium (Candidatus Blackallbacteria) CG17_big_fil_post_rev_8_21_14_2_50_48_46]|uniref:Type VI secretion system spike protein VgrG3-like C-terminal domain-containing protein n=1 Tax=bacterium (Candidatus Blackallbacteria) CG17_big_fil_post_rev_8_21_14_2_50_48_46 TaxID=2014261 RepID=A0A2M7G0G7_9BACT|nr:MAG: hypothetical protein COW64_01240 [bacterium (Candidatus Blackallbacteria) CG18_big_fil_WC_8_21_14_2_50_49_26]PIW15215.1 MAG: hypothetical protein COW36_17490 [bacterium (Candidatus Blackallbacteria) CG17_big_fil_post_rev_8_21_14_2_50_48_46]PIW44802.1 MAG: hypothetical protein COW20_22825 [bacterium (Candidatus Blackallbacteria) CG13_big_fil_rev_8_21_14_2_50_49_14]